MTRVPAPFSNLKERLCGTKQGLLQPKPKRSPLGRWEVGQCHHSGGVGHLGLSLWAGQAQMGSHALPAVLHTWACSVASYASSPQCELCLLCPDSKGNIPLSMPGSRGFSLGTSEEMTTQEKICYLIITETVNFFQEQKKIIFFSNIAQ